MQSFVQTFAGSATWPLNVPGNYFTILSCTNPVNVRLFKNGKKLELGEVKALLAGLEVGPLVPGDGLPYSFDRVEIDATAADTITVAIGNGQARYNRSNGNVAITNVNGAFVNTAATVTNASQSLVAANAARRYLLIQNNDASGDIFVTVDGTAATLAKGIKIKAGQSYEAQGFVPTGQVFAIGSLASNANIVTVEG